ncbi:MAG: sodium:proton antiporter [Spirochaetia bacterium]
MEIVNAFDVSHLAVAMFFLGLYGAMTQRNIIKTIIAINIMDVAAIVFFVTVNYRAGTHPPIAPTDMPIADPMPQALMITAIVIGVSVSAMALAMFMRVAYRYDTADWDILITRNRR